MTSDATKYATPGPTLVGVTFEAVKAAADKAREIMGHIGPTRFIDERGEVVAEILATEFSTAGEITHVVYTAPKYADRIRREAEARGHKMRFVSREEAFLMMCNVRHPNLGRPTT